MFGAFPVPMLEHHVFLIADYQVFFCSLALQDEVM
jgi:hypothetical protein